MVKKVEMKLMDLARIISEMPVEATLAESIEGQKRVRERISLPEAEWRFDD